MRTTIVVVLSLMLLNGCTSATPPTPVIQPQAIPAQAADPILPGCTYAFWHISPGASWTYHVISKGSSYPHPTGAMDFKRTEKIVAVTSGEFHLAFASTDSSEAPWVKIFRCGVSGPAQVANDIERANGMRPSGVFVPAKLESGTEWESMYESGTGNVSTTKFRAIDREQVQVPAGSYNAMRVDYVRTDATGTGMTMKVEGSLWFAPDVGVVNEKFRQSANVGGTKEEGETVEELVEFRP